MKVTPLLALWKDSPRAPMTDFMEVEPSVATEPVSSVSPPEGAEEAAAEAGALPLLPQPASRVSASVAEARMVQNFFIQIFLSES